MIWVEKGVGTDGSYRPGYCLNNLNHNTGFAFNRFRVISCVTYDPGSWSPRNPDHTYAAKPTYISFVGWRMSTWLGLAFGHRCCWHAGKSFLGVRWGCGGAVGAVSCRGAASGCGSAPAAGLQQNGTGMAAALGGTRILGDEVGCVGLHQAVAGKWAACGGLRGGFLENDREL
jgi:hypothetical protein